MYNVAAKCFLLIFFFFLFGCRSAVHSRSIADQIKSIDSMLKIKDVENIFGNLTHGHGPYVWYKHGQDEVWFWFLPKELLDPSEFPIVFITLADSDNTDNVKVIWPDSLIKQNVREVYYSFYAGYEKGEALK